LYKTRENKLLNAYVNGSLNIIEKNNSLSSFPLGIKGLPFNPVVVDPLGITKLSGF